MDARPNNARIRSNVAVAPNSPKFVKLGGEARNHGVVEGAEGVGGEMDVAEVCIAQPPPHDLDDVVRDARSR
jgi:hypothetical protein